MAVIKVPKTPKKAFNKTRRPSALLLSQIEHLEWAVLPASQRKPYQLPKEQVKTEAQAAERVAQLTELVLAAKATAAPATAGAAAVAQVMLPPLPPVSTEPPAHGPRARHTKKSSIARRRKAGRKTAKTAKKTARSAGRRRTRR